MPVKPKGVVLAEFVAEGKAVRARYKSDHKEVDARSPVVELLNKLKP